MWWSMHRWLIFFRSTASRKCAIANIGHAYSMYWCVSASDVHRIILWHIAMSNNMRSSGRKVMAQYANALLWPHTEWAVRIIINHHPHSIDDCALHAVCIRNTYKMQHVNAMTLAPYFMHSCSHQIKNSSSPIHYTINQFGITKWFSFSTR